MLFKNLAFFVALCTVFSCVKDTDFDQADTIVLAPVYELDLIYFTVDAPSFEPTGDLGGTYSVSDYTDLRFLDDSFVVDALKRAEFFFRFNNSIPREFLASIDFVSLTNELQYQVLIPIQAGSLDAPVLTEYTEILETTEQVQALTSAARVIITVSAAESTVGLEGSLNLQSKTTYFLEY